VAARFVDVASDERLKLADAHPACIENERR